MTNIIADMSVNEYIYVYLVNTSVRLFFVQYAYK